MEKELQIEGLQDSEVQDLWTYWRCKPSYLQFLEHAAISISIFGKKKPLDASALAIKAWDTFQSLDETLKQPFSKLSLRDFGMFL